jgi:hypothetical protein
MTFASRNIKEVFVSSNYDVRISRNLDRIDYWGDKRRRDIKNRVRQVIEGIRKGRV